MITNILNIRWLFKYFLQGYPKEPKLEISMKTTPNFNQRQSIVVILCFREGGKDFVHIGKNQWQIKDF